jgi:predicted MFS family arabinose efflux permease
LQHTRHTLLQHTPSQQRWSTRFAFLAAGIAMSAWAALVPFAKARMGLEEAQLGLLLLCLGIGSLAAMPLTGLLASRFGCRPVILISGAAGCLVLPLLALAPTPLLQGLALLVFGAAIGALDVAMNIQAVIVEKEQGGALMSGFHGLFSVGGFAGAGGMALLLGLDLSPTLACGIVAAVAGLALVLAAPNLLRTAPANERDAPFFVMPHGAVILIGGLCFLIFLAEGAVLDWSAVFLTGVTGMAAHQGGLGYAVFAVAMTAGRLSGDRIVRRWGGTRVLLAGGLATAAGFFTVVLAPVPAMALLGFLLVGIGASNIVPVLFTAAGNQRDMPVGLAVSAITTIGYAGILAGPALIGFVSHAVGLHLAFAGLGVAALLVAASARLLARR